MDELVHIFGDRLRKARHVMQFSQTQLARMVNVRQATICDYELGRAMPDFRVVWQLSQVLNVSVSYFFPDTQRSELSEEQRASLALVEKGLSDELRHHVLLLIEQLFKLQNEMGQVNQQSDLFMRFLQQNATQLKWKLMNDGVPLEALAQLVALLLVGGLRGWSANLNLGLEGHDEAAS
jgi:transcriptional regulator with XRE-family HTH domain